jgi:RNA polymerase sigma-70 factor (ECF subfamily)
MPCDAQPERELIQRAADGDADAVGQLFESQRGRLERLLEFRMHSRLRTRVSPSDVIQETFLDASRRLKEFAENPEVPFYVWLRFLACQRLAQLHRHHLSRQLRSAQREISLDEAGNLSWTSSGLANQIAGTLTSPSMAAQKVELQTQLLEVLDRLDEMDREILVLRHFEHLTNSECANILQISPTAASNRYIRALERLRAALGDEFAI